MTETAIQHTLFEWLAGNGYSYVTPNTHVFGWESDLLAISPAGYLVEYEIKTSRGDFLADQRKKRHRTLLSWEARESNARSGSVPSRFLYAVPRGFVDVDDLPPYAGLLYAKPPSTVSKVQSAPRLTSSKARDRHKTRLARSLMWQCFKNRTPS